MFLDLFNHRFCRKEGTTGKRATTNQMKYWMLNKNTNEKKLSILTNVSDTWTNLHCSFIHKMCVLLYLRMWSAFLAIPIAYTECFWLFLECFVVSPPKFCSSSNLRWTNKMYISDVCTICKIKERKAEYDNYSLVWIVKSSRLSSHQTLWIVMEMNVLSTYALPTITILCTEIVSNTHGPNCVESW